MTKKFIVALTGALLLSGAAPLAQASPVDAERNGASGTAGTKANVVVKPVSELTKKPEDSEDVKNAMDGAKISKEKAISIASAFYRIPAGYKQNSIDFQTDWYPNRHSVWNVHWVKQEERMNGNINITVDAETGAVLAMNWYEVDPDSQPSYPPKVDWAAAKDKAEQVISEHFSKLADQLRYNDDAEKNSRLPLKGPMNYYIRFDRIVNGIPFDNNFIAVGVNGDGKVFSLDYRWDDSLKFADAERILNEKQAWDKLNSSLQLELRYQTQYFRQSYGNDPERSRQIVLTYQPANAFGLMDAKSGEWINDQGTVLKSEPVQRTPVSDQPLEPPPKVLDKELTQQEALKIVMDTFELSADEQSIQASYNENWNDNRQAVWYFNWSKQKNGEPGWGYAAVNARTGEIIHFSQDNPKLYAVPDKEFKPKVSAEQAEKMALDVLKKLFPSKVNQVYMEQRDREMRPPGTNQREYTFTFQRLVNDIPVTDQQIGITIAADTGQLTSLYTNWDDSLAFPKPQNVVSAEKAKEVYLQNAELRLRYFMPYPNPVPLENGNNDSPKTVEAKPVYSLRTYNFMEPVYLDAVKGAWISLQTGEEIKKPAEPTDIAGNWAEKELRLMIDYRAIDVGEDGKVHPDKPITRGEMIKMLMYATAPDPVYIQKMAYEFANNKETSFADVGRNSEYFSVVELAVQQGLLDKSQKQLKPDEEVTRAELASLIVRALGLDKLAQVDGLFNLDVNDADQITNKGDVALVTKLGIIPAEEGSFHPDGKVSRAQAAFSFYQFLEKRAELTGRFRPMY